MNRYPITHTDYLTRADIAWFGRLCRDGGYLDDVARAVQAACGVFRPRSIAKIRDDWSVMQREAESLLEKLRNRIYPPGAFAELADGLEAFAAYAAQTAATLAARPNRPTRQKNPVHRDVVRILAEAFAAAGVPMSKSKGSTFEDAVLRVFEAAKSLTAKHAHMLPEGLAPEFPGEEYIHELVCDALAG